jgi:hypothetical protein
MALVVLAGVLAVPSSAAAADFSWSGAASAPNWSAGTNWVGGAAPTAAAGMLSFPALTGCSTCYSSVNDVSGLTANAISIDDSAPYQIGGNGLTLGAGGITAAPSTAASGANITLPLTLSASQSWSITGGSSSQQLGVGTVTGGGSALTVNFASSGILSLSDIEVGAVSLTGAGVAGVFGSLNGTDGNPVTLSSPARLAAQVAGARSGPLTSTGGNIQVGGGHALDGTLAVNGAVNFDSSTGLVMFIDQPGTTASTDYSQLTATGAVDLAGASLSLNNPAAACPALHVGDVDTLVSTTGTLTGTFAGVPDGTTIPLSCTGTAPTVTINYTAHAVTATVASSPAGGTTTTLSSPSNAVTNGPVTLTATVGPNTPTAPSGNVAFYDNGVAISACTGQPVALNGSTYTATCPTSFAAASSPHSLTATFTPASGSGLQSSTSSAAQLTVSKDSTTTTLTVSSATPTVGNLVTYTATVTPGHSGSTPLSGSVQFLDNGTPISDCAGQEALIGVQASCALSYSAPGPHSITVSYPGDANFTGSTSTPAQAVTVVPPTPGFAGTLPSISGNTTEGQTLTETHGSWTNSPTGYNYQWQDCDSVGAHCTSIPGATSQTYTLTASDVGHTIRVEEAAFNAGGPSTGALSSAATAVVRAPAAPPTAPVSASPPVITGTAVVGRTLSTSNGLWSGSPPSGYSYQWQRCSSTACTNIANATGTIYDLTTSDLGTKVRVVVVAVNSAGAAFGVSSKLGPVLGPAQIKALLIKALTPAGKLGKIAAILKADGYEVSFTALESGRVTIGWYLVPAGVHLAKASIVLVASGRATFGSAGKKTIKLKLTAAGKKLLKRSSHVKLTSKGTFTASGQAQIVARKTFTLRH